MHWHLSITNFDSKVSLSYAYALTYYAIVNTECDVISATWRKVILLLLCEIEDEEGGDATWYMSD